MAIQINLPDSIQSFVETQASAGGYPSPDEYVLAVLRVLQKKAREKVEALLQEGLDSGDPIEVTPEYWAAKRERLIQRIGEDAES